MTCDDEDDAPETTKRPRLSSTGFGLKVDERGQKRERIEREIESERGLRKGEGWRHMKNTMNIEG